MWILKNSQYFNLKDIVETRIDEFEELDDLVVQTMSMYAFWKANCMQFETLNDKNLKLKWYVEKIRDSLKSILDIAASSAVNLTAMEYSLLMSSKTSAKKYLDLLISHLQPAVYQIMVRFTFPGRAFIEMQPDNVVEREVKFYSIISETEERQGQGTGIRVYVNREETKEQEVKMKHSDEDEEDVETRFIKDIDTDEGDVDESEDDTNQPNFEPRINRNHILLLLGLFLIGTLSVLVHSYWSV